MEKGRRCRSQPFSLSPFGAKWQPYISSIERERERVKRKREILVGVSLSLSLYRKKKRHSAIRLPPFYYYYSFLLLPFDAIETRPTEAVPCWMCLDFHHRTAAQLLRRRHLISNKITCAIFVKVKAVSKPSTAVQMGCTREKEEGKTSS
jgi:hypothetical protein